MPGTRLRLGIGLVVALMAAAAWLGWAVAAETVAAEEYAAGSGIRADEAVAVGAFVVAAVASVVLHEGAHAAAARALGYRVDWVVVGLIDGKTSYSGRSDRPLDRAAIAMAGPAASAGLVLALLAVGATGTAGPGGVAWAVLWFNVATFGLNLLPVPGSDGWCVAARLVEERRRRRRRPNRSRLGGGQAAQ